MPCLSWWSGLFLQFLYRIQITCRFLTINRRFLSILLKNKGHIAESSWLWFSTSSELH